MYSLITVALAVFVGVLFLVECDGLKSADTVGRYIDRDAGVVCWTYQRGGISCLPFDATTLQR